MERPDASKPNCNSGRRGRLSGFRRRPHSGNLVPANVSVVSVRICTRHVSPCTNPALKPAWPRIGWPRRHTNRSARQSRMREANPNPHLSAATRARSTQVGSLSAANSAAGLLPGGAGGDGCRRWPWRGLGLPGAERGLFPAWPARACGMAPGGHAGCGCGDAVPTLFVVVAVVPFAGGGVLPRGRGLAGHAAVDRDQRCLLVVVEARIASSVPGAVGPGPGRFPSRASAGHRAGQARPGRAASRPTG
jgi:hypothetical protein